MAENAVGATIVAVTTANATSTSVDNDDFEVVGGNLKLKDGASLDFEAADEVVVEITASGAGASATHTVTITVTDINEAPMIAEVDGSGSAGGVTASSTVSENSTDAILGMAGAVLGLVKLSDPDAGQTHTVAVDDDRFQVIDHVGAKWLTLRPGVSLDYEKDGPEVMVKLTVTDDGDPALSSDSEYVFTVNVTDVRETPGITVAGDGDADSTAGDIIASFTVAENSGDVLPGVAGAVLGLITLSDVDSGEVIDDDDFKVSGDTDDRFQVITHAGARWLTLKSGMSLDFEKDGPTVDLTVTVTDPDGNSGSVPVAITVTDVNEAPTISVADGTTPDNKPASSTVAENAKGALLGQITLSDPDKDDMHNVEVVGDDRFEATKDDEGGWWLKLKNDASLDHEAAATVPVTVRVTDFGEPAQSASAEVTITVTDVNEAPTAPQVGTAMVSIDENKLGAPLTVVSGSSDPEGDDFKYEVNNEDFEITADGILKLKDTASLDFEAGGTVVLEVTAVDGFGNRSASAEVTVAVGDIAENRAPTISVADGATPDDKLASSTVAENVKGALLGQITLSDPDKDDMHNVEVVGDDRFEATKDDEGGWWLKLKDEASLDHEAAATVPVTVRVTDSGEPAQSASAEVTITVTDVNEAPTISVADGTTPDNKPASSTVAENAKGALLGQITLSDPDKDDMHNVEVVGDDRFEATKDDEGGWWLKLKDEASLDHEAAATVAVTVRVTDFGEPARSASAEVTITVTDVNEAPKTVKDLDDRFAETGEPISWDVDLTGVFKDDDAGDGILSYSLRSDKKLLESSDKPLKLDISVSQEDGKVTGTISSSSKTIWSNHSPGSFDITVVAADGDEDNPMSGEATFKVHLDDGDDEITAIDLYERNPDGTDGGKSLLYAVNVDENHNQEVVFGRVKVVDHDDPAHPHGQHEVTVDDERFDIKKDKDGGEWLVLKAGNPLNYEKVMGGAIQLEITAKPMMLDAKGKIVLNKDPDTHFKQVVSVDVSDVNDVPKAIANPGNWWVTVPDNLEEEDVTSAGQWLSFQLEMDDDDPDTTKYPAFTDEDSGKNGELKYELVNNSPAWLEITGDGEIRNKKGMLPAQQVNRTYDVTVKATDGGDPALSAMFSFELAVAFSGANNEDNGDPKLLQVISRDVNENPDAGVQVATFTVSDKDSGLTGHPFAPLMPTITDVVNTDDPTDTNNGGEDSGYYSAFKVESRGGNSYRIVTTDKAKEVLDYEKVDDLRITVLVEDGIRATDTLNINVDINGLNEAPDKQTGGNVPTDGNAYSGPGNTPITVGQDETAKQYLWIKLFDFWNDPDAHDDDNDLTSFTAISNVPWIKVIHQPQPWKAIKDGPLAVTWGTIDGILASDAGSAPSNDDDYVVVIEIDRTEANNKQAHVAAGGMITLTVKDGDDGLKGERIIKVNVTDENLIINANAVTLTGPAREDGTLRAVFDETKDPDLAGALEAYQVIYTWYASDNTDGSGGEVRQKGLSDRYKMTQADVGKRIRVDVTYRELEPDGSTMMDFTNNPSQVSTYLSAVASGAVRNTPDRGAVHFNIQANSTYDGLAAEVRIVDEDGVPASGDTGAPKYIWQKSSNGAGGWSDVAADTDTSDRALSLADGNGAYYRLKVEYTDGQGGREIHFSEAVRVGDLEAPGTPPTLTGKSVVGRTLRVNNAGDDVHVQWQKQMGIDVDGELFWVDIADATDATPETLSITREYAGDNVRAVVTYSGTEGITATRILPSGGSPRMIEALPNTDPTAVDLAPDVDQHYVVEAHVDDSVVVTAVEDTVPVASLFDDQDGDKLIYTVSGGPGTDEADRGARHEAIWISANDAGLLSFDANTGKLIYHTDEKSRHDGDPADGGGNIVNFVISATDNHGGTSAEAGVGIRLNVKPSGIDVSGVTTTTFNERDSGPGSDMDLGTIDVRDENAMDHEFGTHTVEVSDPRFKAVPIPGADDGSMLKLMLKKDSTFDYETDGKNGTLTLMLTATDGGGKESAKVSLEITIENDPNDDPPSSIPGTEVPGLDDDDTDDDNDGGWTPPPSPGMSLGGSLVEDLVANADGFDQDLLEDFMLLIDDGIDIA
ncbi:MAG: VCBS domain-containing protein [Gammaproteobacteria bacterium]|nr:VCBS domain-containing protein [Gammaproteobacteria bacterium]